MIQPKQWQRLTLGEICDIASSKRIYRNEYVPEGIPFYRGKEIIQKANNEAITEPLYISIERFQQIKEKHGAPSPGDILLTSVGTLGVPYVVKNSDLFYFKDGNLTWFRDYRGTDYRFLYYWLLSPQMKQQISAAHIGVAQPALTIVGLKGFTIELPPLTTQRRIAAVLSAYDDLIENNTQRITALEAAAQALYRERFVEMRFPGHESADWVESELGRIPSGWEVKPLDELFPNSRHAVKTGPFGSKLHAHDYRNEGVPLLLVKHVDQGRVIEDAIPLVGDHIVPELNAYRLNTGDIVVTRVGFVGRSAYIHPRFEGWLFSGQMLRVRIPDWSVLHPRYLAAFYTTDRFQASIENFAVGATRLSLNTKILAAMPLLIPEKCIQYQFVEQLAPIDQLIQNHTQRIAILREARDLLLPRLISGELSVEDVRVENIEP